MREYDKMAKWLLFGIYRKLVGMNKKEIKNHIKTSLVLTVMFIIPFILQPNHQVINGNEIVDTDEDDKEIYLLNKMPEYEQIPEIEHMGLTEDTYSDAQWALHNPGYYPVFTPSGVKEVYATEDLDMDVAQAWEQMYQEELTRQKVVVAIIDTGVDYLHPDLVDRIWINRGEIPGDGIDNDMNGYVDDVYGWDFYNNDSSVAHYRYDKITKQNLSLPEDNDDHGTHIAGIIGAIADNGIGIAGVASNIDVELMILKINGGPNGSGSITDAIKAIKYATMMGADICNISWGTSQYSPALEQAIKESNMLFVAAAGNLGSDNDNIPVYPASFKLDNLISVTFVDANGRLTKLSNYGKSSVEIAAPGADILSTIVGSYQTLSGSSMAAPQVSAIAALLYSYSDNLYPSNIKDIILRTLKPLPLLEDSIIYPGIPSAYNAVQSLELLKEDMIAPSVELKTIYDKENLIINVKAQDTGGAGLRVVRYLAGQRKVEDFNKGVTGLEVNNNQIKVSRAGVYTVYASDYAGNESIKVYEVKDDLLPPTIYSSYSVSDDYKTRTISIRVFDNQSGVKRVKYLPGERKVEEFLPANSGNDIKLEKSRATFKVEKDGTYTLYAIDHRGNQRVKIINIKTVKSEDLKIARSEMIMGVGEVYYLRAFVKPVNTTDLIAYSSSNDRIITVNSKGKITALREGTAIITVSTSSGHKVICRIVVLKRSI